MNPVIIMALITAAYEILDAIDDDRVIPGTGCRYLKGCEIYESENSCSFDRVSRACDCRSDSAE